MSAIGKRGARAIADLDRGTILASVDIAAPPERVFRAITSAEEIVQWWGSAETYRTTKMVMDLRSGGRWRANGVSADGETFVVEGEFREVEPPHKLVQTWKADWDGSHETILTYQLHPIEGGTRVTVRHEGFGHRADSCRAHGEGWERVLGWLANHVTPPAAGTEPHQYFLCRLLPPRPTFAEDMTPEEAEVMGQHAAYWTRLLKERVAVAFGPVADPAGAWGVGIVCTTGEEQMRILRDGDPAIRSGRGLRYEILPMIRAVVRD